MSDDDKRGKIPRKTWSPIPGLKITPPSEELSSEPDIRDYQLARQRHEYEGAPEPTAPRRPVVVNAPIFGGRKELGSLPYNYANAANTVLNSLYGMKTKPFYTNPYTAPFASAIDAYESAKRIQEDPYSVSSYTGLIPIARSGSPVLGAAGGASAAYAAASAPDSEEQQPTVDRSRSPVFRQGGDEMDAMRLANGITEPDRFSQMIERGRQNIPMRHSYGTRHGSTDLKDIGFKGPIENAGHQVTEYSADRDYQYPSIYSGISEPDLKTVLSAERFHQNTPESMDDRAYAAAQQRVGEGRSPFYEPGKDEYPAWSPDQNWEQPAVMRGSGGKTNSIIDKNPEWRMSLEEGGTPDEGGQQQFLQEQLKGSAPQYDPEGGMETAKEAGKFVAGLTTPGAIADAAGYLGGPSALQNIREGNYGTAALQAASAIPGVGPLAKGLGAAHLAMSLVPKARVVEDAVRLAKESPAIDRAVSRYKDPASEHISDWEWRKLKDVQKDIGTREVPEHVQNFGRYMDEISDKAATEGLDPEDAIKAYMITRSSIQREGRTPQKLASYGIPVRETEEPIIRPEGHMADFLASPMGTRFLNEARRGELSQDVVDAAQAHMKPFGMSSTEPDAMDWARRNLPDRTSTISDLVARARRGESSPSEWRGLTAGIKGIGPAKSGFIGSLLGRGDLPTLDARQAILHTGLKNAEAQKIMQKKSGRAGHEAVDRLAARQKALKFELPEYLQPYYQHLAHHTVWDTIGNERTTHQDIIDAMRPRANGGPVVEDALRVARDRLGVGGKPQQVGGYNFRPEFGSDREALMAAGYAEASGEFKKDPEMRRRAIEAVMHNVQNRALGEFKLDNKSSNAYWKTHDPHSIRDQVLAPKQYSSFNPNSPEVNIAGRNALKALQDPKVREEFGSYADNVMGRMTPDPTHGASNYRNSAHSSAASNKWFNQLQDRTEIGHHSFGRAPGFNVPEDRPTPQIGDAAMMQKPGPTPQAMQMAGLQGDVNVPQGVPSTMMAQASGMPPMPQQAPTQIAQASPPPPPTPKPASPPPMQMAKATPTTPVPAPTPTTPKSTPSQMASQAPKTPPQVAANIDIGKPPQPTPMQAPQDVAAADMPDETSTKNFMVDQNIGIPDQPAPEAPAPDMPDMTAGMESMFMARGGLVDHALKIAHDAMNKGGGAWTRKEGQNPRGGLNAKGRASLKAQGHDIKPPQPEGGPRKDSFCARSAGQMKMFPEAAKDPNSRLRKARRVWNCADGGEVWDKPRPKKLGKSEPLSDRQKASAKASAKAAGRPYPNLVDNLRAARKD